jgi:hypothetical protein
MRLISVLNLPTVECEKSCKTISRMVLALSVCASTCKHSLLSTGMFHDMFVQFGRRRGQDTKNETSTSQDPRYPAYGAPRGKETLLHQTHVQHDGRVQTPRKRAHRRTILTRAGHVPALDKSDSTPTRGKDCFCSTFAQRARTSLL